MTDTTATSAPAAGPARSAPFRALASWALFDWSVQPFYTLIQTFLFAPYFATVVVADPAHPDQGAAIWGYAAAAAGLLVAILSPILGAIADAGGRRKPWIALFALLMIVGSSLMWLAVPHAQGWNFWLVVGGYMLGFASAEFAAVFVNSIMPSLVTPDKLGRLSGIGWGVGYAGGLVSLILVAGFLVTDPESGRTLLGLKPLLTLDAVSRASDRLVGPFSALWFALFVIPFFLFVPDRSVSAGKRASVGQALTELGHTIKELPSHRDILLLLLARLLYSDALAAIFIFGGIYGTAVFVWSTFDRGLFGIVLSLAGAVGAVIGGFLDDRLGAKTVIIGALLLMLIGVIGILSIDRDHVLFTVPVAAKAAGSTTFSSLAEQVYLAFAVLIGLVAAPVQASTRSLLARLAPADRVTQFFGLFAFSGKATAFLAPLAIALITQATGSQRWGIAVTALFLVAGVMFMTGVKRGR